MDPGRHRADRSRAGRREARIRLIDLPANRGRGHARRTGIAAARGGLIATVDAATVLPADWLERTRAALTGHDAVGGTAVPDGDVAYVSGGSGSLREWSRQRPPSPGATDCTGAACSTGLGFDETLREGEDSALNHAISRLGLSAATVPGLLVQHRECKSFGTSLRWLFETGQGATRQLITYRECASRTWRPAPSPRRWRAC